MANFFSEANNDDWRQRLAIIMDMMKEMSLQTDPQEMVRSYGEKVRRLLPSDRRLSLSRRGLAAPKYRVTRSTTWSDNINPWKDKDRLPIFEGGLLAKLIYEDRAEIIDDLEPAPNEPAAEYLAGHRSLLAIPLFEQGDAVNMVIMLRKEPGAFSREQLPELVWMSNLFGRATSTLVMSGELKKAYAALDNEFRVVGNIQRSLTSRRSVPAATIMIFSSCRAGFGESSSPTSAATARPQL
jgi:sigma-B regulation protein RsbU (phosphoserine phosphatase)